MNPLFRQSPFDENEIAKFQNLFSLDEKKLASRLPTWIKSHMRSIALPKQFVFIPNAKPVYPTWYFTKQHDIHLCIPPYFEGKSTQAYIESFDSLNNLRSIDYEPINY